MKAATITAPGVVDIVEQSDPHSGGDVVVVQILVAPLCTEYRDRASGNLTDHVGHEAAGIVIDAGTSTRVTTGQRVVVMPQFGCGRCRYCLSGEHIYCPFQRDVLTETGSAFGTGTVAQYVLKPDWLLVPVPDDISLEHAAMACCGFGPTFQAHQRLSTNALDTVVISGCGPVGLGGIAQAVTRGARVYALETQEYRADLAGRMGAAVLDPRDPDTAKTIKEATGGWGADKGIETSGARSAGAGLMTLLRPRADLGVVAWTNELTLGPVIPSGMTLHACWHWNHLTSSDAMWTSIRRSRTLIDTQITHRMPLEEVSAAMDLQDAGACGKIILYPFGATADALAARTAS
ncbi:alcohol dehydrogenase [Frondihabitans sucicola]|uniref:Alcohol dehydrogenase n=1 Tax=Frondihabitans sucicola TaxID=1268041 RepID=A0ABN6XSK8_9MICO|nr:zinc-binding dehydrogenase [Frondihabitans sucicola]BDZ47982.1 alcohol dehydrogenase [Frondihabitans sucicola]